MRKRGAGAVIVIVLVAIILAGVGFIVYWTARGSRPSTVPADSGPKLMFGCAAGCGWTGTLTLTELEKLKKGPAFSGKGLQLRKCPGCGEFSLGELAVCPKCNQKYADIGEPCPHCAKGK